MIHLLVDGYNLMHALDPRLIKTLEEKRQDLIERLSAYQSKKGVDITVVFDGAHGNIFASRDRYQRVTIVFTLPPQSADDWIIRECEENPGNYLVVSNDQEIVRAAETNGCMSLSTDLFIGKMEMAKAYDDFEVEEERDDSAPLYPKISTKKKGVAKKAPKRERRKLSRLKNL
jgi:predicted RNA-binding protein with PIN domain